MTVRRFTPRHKIVDLRATATAAERAEWPQWTVPPREEWGKAEWFEPGERVRVNLETGARGHVAILV